MLIRYLDVDVFQMNRIAEVFGGAIEFSMHGGDPDDVLSRHHRTATHVAPIAQSALNFHPFEKPPTTRRLRRLANAAGSSGSSPSRICACSSSRNERSAASVPAVGI